VATLREELMEAHRTGSVLRKVYDSGLRLDEHEPAIASELAALHNEGLVDITAAFKSFKHDDSGVALFLAEQVFDKALPDIQSPVVPLLQCILQFYVPVGRDLAAAGILQGFSRFCANDPSRPRQVLDEIEKDPAALVGLLIPALHAFSVTDYDQFLKQATRLMGSENTAIKRQTIYALSGVQWPDPVPDAIWTALEHSIDGEQNDQVLANIVWSTFALTKKDKLHEQQAAALIDAALQKGGEQSLHSAAMIFAFNTAEIPPSVFDLLRKNLNRIPLENAQSLGCVGFGLQHLFEVA